MVEMTSALPNGLASLFAGSAAYLWVGRDR